MQDYITTDQPFTQPLYSESEVDIFSDPKYTSFDSMLDTSDEEFDNFTLRYFRASQELQKIIEEHDTLLEEQPEILTLLQKLLHIFQDVTDDNAQAFNELANVGETQLLNALDMLDELGTASTSLSKSNEYAELEIQLTELYRQCM